MKFRGGSRFSSLGKVFKSKDSETLEEPKDAPAKMPDTAGDTSIVAQSEAIKSILDDEEWSIRGRNAEFDEFLDERMLISRNMLGKKEMKIKVLEVSDEHPPSRWKLGDRIKVKKILVIIKHSEPAKIEEAKFDIEEIERKLAEERHYTSSNRWVPISDIKGGYVLKTRHMSLISDAIALDCIVF